MHKLIRTLREQGTRRLVGTVLVRNHSMLALAHRLGFVQTPSEHADGTKHIHLGLQPDVALAKRCET